MKKNTLAALTNVFLALVLVFVGAVCFLPSAGEVASVNDRVIYRGSSADGVSLMFNVYWGTEEVYGILGVLEDYGAKATFFLGGSWADDNTACVEEIAARGHEIGSHGYFHRDHEKLGYEDNLKEIGNSVRFLNLAGRVQVSLFAPPSGAFNGDTVAAAEALGLRTVMWSRDTVDWRDKDEDLCLSRATEGISGGDLVLMHPMKHTLAALPKVLAYYGAHGLRAITVGENIG